MLRDDSADYCYFSLREKEKEQDERKMKERRERYKMILLLQDEHHRP
jgi:hypothetical protein